MTLSACANGGPTPRQVAPDPVIETRETTRLVCPDELRRPLPALASADGVVITHNDAGGAYLDARIARGDAAEAIVTDAKAACAKAGAK